MFNIAVMASNLSDALQMYAPQEKKLSYGTAGFRENVALPLHSVFVKMGIMVRALNSSDDICRFCEVKLMSLKNKTKLRLDYAVNPWNQDALA